MLCNMCAQQVTVVAPSLPRSGRCKNAWHDHALFIETKAKNVLPIISFFWTNAQTLATSVATCELTVVCLFTIGLTVKSDHVST